jgi:hypothetical protein
MSRSEIRWNAFFSRHAPVWEIGRCVRRAS